MAQRQPYVPAEDVNTIHGPIGWVQQVGCPAGLRCRSWSKESNMPLPQVPVESHTSHTNTAHISFGTCGKSWGASCNQWSFAEGVWIRTPVSSTISLLNVEGKLFFSILPQCLKFLLKNTTFTRVGSLECPTDCWTLQMRTDSYQIPIKHMSDLLSNPDVWEKSSLLSQNTIRLNYIVAL